MRELFPLNPNIKFRKCQTEAVDALLDYWRAGGQNPVLNLCTGSGKSMTIGEICRQLLNIAPQTRIGVVTINQELVQQDEADIKLVCPKIPVGVVMASLKRKEYKSQVIVGSIQSLYKSLGKTGGFHVILVDEGHLISLLKPEDPETGERPEDTTMFGKFLAANGKIVPNFRTCALTATPWRDNNKPIFGWERARFTKEIYRFGIGEAIELGYLVPPITEVQEQQINTSGLKVSSSTGDFTEKALAAVANDDRINVPAVKKTIEKLEGGRDSAVVFCVSVEHAYRVRDMFRKAGVDAEAVHGSHKEYPLTDAQRQKIISDFRSGKFKVIVNCLVLLIGFDHKRLDLITVLRPTRSSAAWLQLIGRGLRTAPGTSKTDCLVLDFTENSEYFGPIDLIEPPAPPKPKPKRENEIGNLRDCPECMALIAMSSRSCPQCGYEFPINSDGGLDLSDEASTARLLSTQAQPDRTFKVTSWNFSKGQKTGKPPYLRVDYFDGFRQRGSDFILLCHGGAPRTRATRWWLQRGGGHPVPNDVDEAMDRISEVGMPTAITVRKDGRYDKVVRELDTPIGGVGA